MDKWVRCIARRYRSLYRKHHRRRHLLLLRGRQQATASGGAGNRRRTQATTPAPRARFCNDAKEESGEWRCTLVGWCWLAGAGWLVLALVPGTRSSALRWCCWCRWWWMRRERSSALCTFGERVLVRCGKRSSAALAANDWHIALNARVRVCEWRGALARLLHVGRVPRSVVGLRSVESRLRAGFRRCCYQRAREAAFRSPHFSPLHI